MKTTSHSAAPRTGTGDGFDAGLGRRVRAMVWYAASVAIRFAALRVLGPGGDAVALAVLSRACPLRVSARLVAGWAASDERQRR